MQGGDPKRAYASHVTPGEWVAVPKDAEGKLDKTEMRRLEAECGLCKDAKGRFACWDFNHPQGCGRASGCKFHHEPKTSK